MSNQRRAFRVADKIRTTIALQLQRVADPRFHLVTITSVVVSPDLRYAKVYWVVSGEKERIEEVSEAFETANSIFKKAVGKELGVRYNPDIEFFYDDTLETVEEVERLFQKVRAGSRD